MEIHSVLYLGNEAGISCDIKPKGREDTPVVCSLTQLEVIGIDSPAEEMKAYQQKQIKDLARYPGNKLYRHAEKDKVARYLCRYLESYSIDLNRWKASS